MRAAGWIMMVIAAFLGAYALTVPAERAVPPTPQDTQSAVPVPVVGQCTPGTSGASGTERSAR